MFVGTGKNSYSPKVKTKTIKNRPSSSFKKVTFYGIIAGTVIGIPVYNTTYNYISNLPTSNNYITVKESKKGIDDRKEHDSSKYKKYLVERCGLTEEEADKRIEKEEELGRWR